jgi:hypothetical protein
LTPARLFAIMGTSYCASVESILSHPNPVSGVGEGVGDGHAVDERDDCGVGGCGGVGVGCGVGGATVSVGVGEGVVVGDGHAVGVAGVGDGDRAVFMRWLYPVA